MDTNNNTSGLIVGELRELVKGEMKELLREALAEVMREEMAAKEPATAFGLQGLADTFGVSISQAKRMRATGELDKAITQCGRTILVDTALARKLWAKGASGRRN